jgi:hypothetical protein
VPDRPGWSPGDEDLPPDPFGPPAQDPFGPPAQDPFGPPPTRSRSLWQHPAVWVGVVVLALILLVGALLEPRPAPQREPSPDAVSTAGFDPRS